MSALGWGIIIGSTTTAVAFAPRAFRDATLAGWGIFGGGVVLGWLLGKVFVPDGWEIAALAGGVLVSTAPFWLLGRSAISALDDERGQLRQQIEQERALKEARRAQAAADKRAWFSGQRGWDHQCEAKILNLPGQPRCVAMLGGDGRLFRLVEYRQDEQFSVSNDTTIAVNKIISLDIARPTIQKTVYTTQAVPIVTKKQRSPVGRAVVGGVLLGPLGAVVGAASGLGGKLSTEVEERKVAQRVDALGDPQLIIGTSDSQRPILKIKFDPPGLAEEWLYRIRGAQAR